MTRCLAIGDIHGCFRSLTTLLDRVAIQDDDLLITLGDYVDRGPQSREVIDWLIAFDRTNRLVPLLGNHEQMMLAARNDVMERRRWAQYGANDTLDSYTDPGRGVAMIDDIPGEHWRFIANRLVLYHETDTHLFVHGSVDPDKPMEAQQIETLAWKKYSDAFPGHASGKPVVCGHTSQKSGLPTTNGQAICIDTNACRGGWLTCLDTDSGAMWQANETGESRTLHLDDLPDTNVNDA